MIKKRKKMLFLFIVIIIAVLLFSVIWVITVYLWWWQEQAGYPADPYGEGIQINAEGADWSPINIEGELISAPAVGTGS